MKIGDAEVFTISEAATRYGLARKTLLTQVRREKLAATKSGNVFLVTDTEMERYMRETAGKPGFASPLHYTAHAPRKVRVTVQTMNNSRRQERACVNEKRRVEGQTIFCPLRYFRSSMPTIF